MIGGDQAAASARSRLGAAPGHPPLATGRHPSTDDERHLPTAGTGQVVGGRRPLVRRPTGRPVRAAYLAGVTARQTPARWWRRDRDEAQAALADARARSAMSFYDLDAVQRPAAARAAALDRGPRASRAETEAVRDWPAVNTLADAAVARYLGLQHVPGTDPDPDPDTSSARVAAAEHRAAADALDAALRAMGSYADRHDDALTVAVGRANAAAALAAAEAAARAAADRSAVSTAVDAAQRAADALTALTADGFAVPQAAAAHTSDALAAADLAVAGGPDRAQAAADAVALAAATETVCADARARWAAGGLRATTLRTRADVLDARAARAQADLEHLAVGWTVNAWYPIAYGARRARAATARGRAGLTRATDALGARPKDTARLAAALTDATREFDEADRQCTAVRSRRERLEACRADPGPQAKQAGFAVREAARYITAMLEPRKTPLAARQDEIAARYDRARSDLRTSPGRPDLGLYLDRLDEARAAAEALLAEARGTTTPPAAAGHARGPR